MPLLRQKHENRRTDRGARLRRSAERDAHGALRHLHLRTQLLARARRPPRRGRARRPHAHRPHLSDTKGHSRGPWKANGLHSTAHTGEYALPKPYEWRHVRHQTGCGRHQTPAVWNAPVTEARGSGIWVGDRRSRSGVLGRSDGDAECSDHDFYPGNGTGAVARARLARNRSSRPGWMAWSERRSSIPCPSRLGWASRDIVTSKARDGSSSVRRECGRESGLFEQHPGGKPLGGHLGLEILLQSVAPCGPECPIRKVRRFDYSLEHLWGKVAQSEPRLDGVGTVAQPPTGLRDRGLEHGRRQHGPARHRRARQASEPDQQRSRRNRSRNRGPRSRQGGRAAHTQVQTSASALHTHAQRGSIKVSAYRIGETIWQDMRKRGMHSA